MLHDYLRSFWLGVLHNKVSTLINVGGLALGLAVFIALSFYVHREFSWDDHWEDADRIYRATGTVEAPNAGNPFVMSGGPWAIGTALQARNPGAFAAYARIYYSSPTTLRVDGEEHQSQLMAYAEPALLDLVQLDTLEGSLQDVFADPRSIAIDVDLLDKLFGGRSLLGKTLTLDGKADHVVKAIYRVPQPTSLRLPLLALLDPAALPATNVGIDLWDIRMMTPQPPQSQAQAQTPAQTPAPAQPPQIPQMPLYVEHYFKLQPTVAPEPIAADLRAFMDQGRYMESVSSKTRFSFQQLQEVHLGASFLDHSDNVLRLWAYAAIGALVLLISGCNFVMLATLRSVDRMREVGIRKTLGGAAGQLLRRYLLDAFLLTFIAACLALTLLELAVPALQGMLGQLPQFRLGWRGLAACFGIVTGFALLSGLYPAWLMARGKPVALLRGSSGALATSGSPLRKLLVGIQFAIVIGLLLGSAVLQQQIAFMQTRDRGFSLDKVLGIYFRATEHQMNAAALVTEFGRVPGVQQAAVGLAPGAVTIGSLTNYRRVAADGTIIDATLDGGTSVGAGYFSLMSVPLLAGREFSVEVEGSAQAATVPDQANVRSVVLNASAVRALGFPSPDMALDSLLERDIRSRDGQQRTQSMRVVGVVADMQFVSALLAPVPQAYSFTPQNSFLAVKLESGADVATVRAALEERWHAVLGDAPFEPLFADQLMSNQLQREELEARIVTGSTVLAIMIAVLGLYGMAAASVVKRVKEIGVRKVMGADTAKIVGLLLWQLSTPVMAANLVAWPLGFWGALQWLARFPYRLDMQAIVLSGLAASALALGIAWLTVGLLAARAANQKPVLALRYE